MVDEDTLPMPDPFKDALRDAYNILRQLEEEQAGLKIKLNDVDKRLAKHRFKMITVASLVEDEIPEHIDQALTRLKRMGLTDAVREALKAADDEMSAMQIRDKLLQVGYDLSGYKNIQAAIHTILKRLEKMGDVLEGLDENFNETGKYMWYPFDTFKPDPAGDALKRYRKQEDATKKAATAKVGSAKKAGKSKK